MCVKPKIEHLQTLIEFYDHLLDQGHTFWHCSLKDDEHNRPFYYVQIHRTKHMSTCSTCYKLIELKNRIRKIQKELTLPQWPIRWKTENHNWRPKISVNNPSEFNPNLSHLKSLNL